MGNMENYGDLLVIIIFMIGVIKCYLEMLVVFYFVWVKDMECWNNFYKILEELL